MRHIVLDTETTGLNAEGSDRIIEIGALELVNYVPTGRVYHQYINPEHPIDPGAMAVHGITDERVANEPTYAEIVGALDEFLGDDVIVAHNAEFDMRFLNAEYKRLGLPAMPMTRALDTLAMARKLFPGAPNSLDALCKRFNVDNSQRTYHGALMDARLLADVFLELQGGRQPELLGKGGKGNNASAQQDQEIILEAVQWPVRSFAVAADELAAHETMVAGLKSPIWKQVEGE